MCLGADGACSRVEVEAEVAYLGRLGALFHPEGKPLRFLRTTASIQYIVVRGEGESSCNLRLNARRRHGAFHFLAEIEVRRGRGVVVRLIHLVSQAAPALHSLQLEGGPQSEATSGRGMLQRRPTFPPRLERERGSFGQGRRGANAQRSRQTAGRVVVHRCRTRLEQIAEERVIRFVCRGADGRGGGLRRDRLGVEGRTRWWGQLRGCYSQPSRDGGRISSWHGRDVHSDGR